jgi:hypothetical protein
LIEFILYRDAGRCRKKEGGERKKGRNGGGGGEEGGRRWGEGIRGGVRRKRKKG